jgi:hypothetical protein
LVASGIRLRWIIRKVETLQRRVAGASVAGEDEPRLFVLLAGVEELELSVGNATKLSIYRGRLRAIALTDDLNEALAGVDLVPEDLAEVARLSPKDLLNNRCVAQPR